MIEFRDSAEPAVRMDGMADFLNRSINLIRNIPAIVIAVVEGLAVGAGMSLALACDLTLAETKAVMNMGYRRIGLTPDGGGSIFLPRLVGMKRFNELYFLSRNVTMEEAKEMGLVNFVVDEGDLEEELATLIEELKALPMETTAKDERAGQPFPPVGTGVRIWTGRGSTCRSSPRSPRSRRG